MEYLSHPYCVFYDKYAHLRSCMESLSRPHCAFIINTHTAALCGIFVTAAPRICDKNAHVRSQAESWSRPQMRIHDSRIRVESLSHPQLRIYDYFVDFFPVLVSRVGCGIRLYRFRIIAFSSTFKINLPQQKILV